MPRPVLTLDEILAILPETPRRVAALTDGVAMERLHAAPESGAWSVNDVLAHLRACHEVLGGNVIRIVSEDRPAWKGMSPRAWIRKTDYPTWAFAPAFEAFRRQRAELLCVVESMAPNDWDADRDRPGHLSARRSSRAPATTPIGWRPMSACTGATSSGSSPRWLARTAPDPSHPGGRYRPGQARMYV